MRAGLGRLGLHETGRRYRAGLAGAVVATAGMLAMFWRPRPTQAKTADEPGEQLLG
jgi:hypothetical protein